MEKALETLRSAGIDAYIESGRLYFRPGDGGVMAVNTENEMRIILERAKRNPSFYVTLAA